MTRALIADDESHLAQYLGDQLRKLWPELEIVALARNGDEAARAASRRCSPTSPFSISRCRA